MPTVVIAKHRRSLIIFIATLLVFLLVFGTIIFSQQRDVTLNALEQHTRQEVMLLGELTSAALTRGNYAEVEQALSAWGQFNTHILQAKLTTENGFLLAEYTTPHRAFRSQVFRDAIHYGRHKKAHIEVHKNMDFTDTALRRLAATLFGFSSALVTLLGLFLYHFAIKPLQQEIEGHLETENRLRENASALQAANEELQSFSYSLSHDLRTPLRAITSYSQIIVEEDGERLSEESKGFFSRIVEASKHMASLIDDILILSLIGRYELTPEPINLSALALRAVQSHYKSEAKQIDCEIEPDLIAQGNDKLLGQLIDNLIGNAVKYTARQPSGKIHFGAHRSNGETVYFVQDNGTGFDMRYVDQVFEPFRRLHDQSDYTGTGIGMAIAKRIVTRHGGRIWVESEPGAGTTFYFTLGLRPDSQDISLRDSH